MAVLAREAHGRLCTKEAQRKDVLAGKLDPGYQLLPKQNLEQVELMRRQRGEIHDALAAGDEGAATLVRLTKIPGVPAEPISFCKKRNQRFGP